MSDEIKKVIDSVEILINGESIAVETDVDSLDMRKYMKLMQDHMDKTGAESVDFRMKLNWSPEMIELEKRDPEYFEKIKALLQARLSRLEDR